jgi:hypothetical protein
VLKDETEAEAEVKVKVKTEDEDALLAMIDSALKNLRCQNRF